MNPGQRVRLINDPGRVGILTGRALARTDLTRWEVQFLDAAPWVPEDQLEILVTPWSVRRSGFDFRRLLVLCPHVPRVRGRPAFEIHQS